ncbi:MAG TPA: hydantoinase/oxoprolinase family protein [Solirubrobacterales bacterium]|nr:hydantoinase/oxoprolinase family protein [Solirubrobacterales bacterium]
MTQSQDQETSYRCGVDIGGTFTDCVVVDDQGRITLAKAPSTPPNFARGFIDVLRQAAERTDQDLETLLGRTSLLLHGTTVGTNVLVQMKGARTGLITTRGHRDVMVMMRSFGRSAGLPIDRLLHVSRHEKPAPIVPRSLIAEVSERIDWEGDVVLPLNEEEARAAVRGLLADGVEAIAISFLWGFANPDHESRMRAIVEEEAPEIFVTCSHEIAAKVGEYERTTAAVINAFIGPATADYVGQVDGDLTAGGYRSPLLLMQASGGVMRAAEAARRPLFTIGSGPVGGVTGAAFLAETMGRPNVMACDMGGTSFDVGLIVDGVPIAGSEAVINQNTFYMPRLDIESIGAGAGSILWRDEHSETLRVGPQSAGALPGPACYSRGGTEPTVTDCNVLLGRFATDSFLGGTMALDHEKALRALESLSGSFDMDPVELADGALRIIESHMADLMRQLSVQRGRDPRDFSMFAFGGAGAAHAVALARELGCPEVIVPLGDLASTWSALGVMTADVLHVYERAALLSLPFDPATVNAIFAALEAEARAELEGEGFGTAEIELSRVVEMKFPLQVHRVDVEVPPGELDETDMEEQMQRFVIKYEQLYGAGSAFADAGAEIGLFRVVARGVLPKLALAGESGAAGEPEPRTREVYWRELGGFHATPIHDAASCVSGFAVEGPAVIDLPVTTVVIPPGARGVVDEVGSIAIDVGSSAGSEATSTGAIGGHHGH